MEANNSIPTVETNDAQVDEVVSLKTETPEIPPSKSKEAKEEPKENDMDSRIKKTRAKYVTQNDGNITNQYIFNIDKMIGDVLDVVKERATIEPPKKAKRYKLHERSDCSKFVNEYKSSLHLAYAIAISMFEYVPVSDLQSLSDRLLKRFPKTLDSEGKEDKTYTNPFLSLDEILTVIGAETCKVSFKTRFENITERCICFSTAHDKVMENLWDLFPMIRSEITAWLIETDFIYQFRNAFSTSCFVRAMFNIVKLDFGDSINRLFPQLESNPHNKYLMMRLFLSLVEDTAMKKNACEVLKRWASSASDWLWEIPLVVFAKADTDLPFRDSLKRTVNKKMINCFEDDEEWDLTFIGGQMVTSAKLRTLVSEVFDELISESGRSKDKNYAVAVIYLLTTLNAYRFVEKDDMVLPLVAFDSREQSKNVEAVLLKTITDFSLRQGLFDVLGAYLNEIDEYEYSPEFLNRIKGFFFTLSIKAPRYYNDITRFLSRLSKNETAASILEFLQEKINPSKELLKV